MMRSSVRGIRPFLLPAALIMTFMAALFGVPGNAANRPAQAQAIHAPLFKTNVCDFKNAVLLGSSYGLNCLDESGWNELNSDSVLKATGSSNFAACTDGALLVPYAFDLSVFDGTKLTKLPKPPTSTGFRSACSSAKDIWYTAGTSDLLHFDGKAWLTIKSEEIFGKKPGIGIINAIAVSTEGTSVWVASSDSLARFEDGKWQVFGKGSGFVKDVSAYSLAFDGKGTLWVGLVSGLAKFDGKAFTVIDNSKVYARSIAPDSKGNIWVGTGSEGVFQYDGKKWTQFSRKENAIGSNRVNDVTVDSQDRVWVGTNWGLSVYDGKAWTIFQMSNSDLKDNTVNNVILLGAGPKTLPKLVTRKPGIVKGKIVQGRDPVKETVIELCSEGSPVAIFRGKTPCGDYPDARSATTDADGEFEIADVPVGRYGFVVKGSDGKWYTFFGSGSNVVVKEGETKDMEIVNIKSSN